jgi:hypothetical protein
MTGARAVRGLEPLVGGGPARRHCGPCAADCISSLCAGTEGGPVGRRRLLVRREKVLDFSGCNSRRVRD